MLSKKAWSDILQLLECTGEELFWNLCKLLSQHLSRSLYEERTGIVEFVMGLYEMGLHLYLTGNPSTSCRMALFICLSV